MTNTGMTSATVTQPTTYAWSRNWPAPAKLNLMLHITGRRADGYHELQTVFQLLEWGDVLSFRQRDDGEVLRLSELAGVPDESDLVVKAARLLQRHADCKFGADILVDKRLPMGGGLGGGSSDAATTLVALNTIWKLGLSTTELCELGLQLGADVPVFIAGNNAWAEGIGEKLTAISLPDQWFLVAVPACSVSTAEVFGSRELTRDTPISTIRAFLEHGGHNDCQKLVKEAYSEVRQVIDCLSEFSNARLTGTGACVFAGFNQLPQAMCAFRAVAKNLPVGTRIFLTKGVQCSSLLARLEQEVQANVRK